MITYEQFLQIQECKSYDLSVQTTSRKLGIEIYDVRNWWNKTEDEFLEADGRKACELDNYRQYIIELIKICPQISNANVMSRLQEDFSDFDAKKSTFQRYMKNLREQTGIGSAKKIRRIREELPPGYEAQVDFGEYKMRNMYGKETKVYFFCMILSYSRMKYVYFSPDPFTSQTAIEAHKYAFKYFGGRPQVIVYDQARVFVVSENYGDIIFVKAFDKFVKEAGFSVFLCKGHDPSTKGKVENMVKTIKYNFLEGRTYYGIDRLNCDCLNWLDRTGNNTVNTFTQKTPRQMFIEDNKALIRVRFEETPQPEVHIMKDGYIRYLHNRYEMPQELVDNGDRIRVEVQEDTLLFYIALTNEMLCKHTLCKDTGQTIKLPKKRSSPLAIEIEMLRFYKDNPLALEFIERMKMQKQRYVSRQLVRVKKASSYYTEGQMNKGFQFCIDSNECTTVELLSFLLYKYGQDLFKDCYGAVSTGYKKRSKEIQEAFNDGHF